MKPARVVAIACALFLFACGGGGGGGGGGSSGPAPATNLAGIWAGTMEDGAEVMHTMSVTIDATGKITQIVISGINTTGLTGNIFVAGTNLYSLTLSDGTKGGFFADATATHAAFLDDNENTGVLQKGAGALPAFAAADVVGSWSGYDIDLDAAFNVTQTYNSSVTIANNGTRTFAGTDTVGGAFTGSLPTVDTTNGRWSGTFTNAANATISGPVHVFMSTDKTFAASWACDAPFADFVADCVFSAWHK